MKKILVVDDNPSNLTLISGVLYGIYKVYPVDSGVVALKFLEKQHPDLILLDVEMPNLSGIELIKIIKSEKRLSDIPIIFLTALNDTDNETRAFDLGAVDYIHKPVNSAVMLARVRLHLELESYRKELQELVEIKTSQNTLLQRITIELLTDANEYRDKSTGNHIKRTTGYVCAIMDGLSKMQSPPYYISPTLYEDIKKSAPLHDIGKISIPDSILLKPGSLTSEEFEVIKTHVNNGAALLQKAINEFNGPSFLDTALEMAATHHEKWDGMGYPNHLAGENIPISGRVMAIADVYDALTSERPYKLAFTHEKAIEIMREESGSHFDPILIDVFLQNQNEILSICDQYKAEQS